MSSAAHPSVLASVPGPTGRTVNRAGAAAGVPWYIWAGVLGVTSASTGLQWDIAWHRSIGRDTFWTPAHMMVYLGGLLAAVTGLWLLYECTFHGNSRLRAASVNVFGLRAPLGVFVAGWGGIALVTAGLFDGWWHAAYGLDVQIVSPPHTVMMLGQRAVSLGISFLILGNMNRAEEGSASFLNLRNVLLYMGGLTVVGQMFFQVYTWDVSLHSTLPYVTMGLALPVVFAMFWQASRFRWASTTTAGIYMLFIIGEILTFPLIPAEPKLGPVYFPVTHLVPTKFPPLLLFPALAMDLLWQRTRHWKVWQVAIVSGVLFVAVLAAVEWPFATFLLSKASENRFFGTIYFSYDSTADSADRIRTFLWPASGLVLARGLVKASIYASLSAGLGLVFGRWMRDVQR